jgi:hypothetical protein
MSMRRLSWFCVGVILFKLSLSSVMAMPALGHLHHPTEQTLAVPACHGASNTHLKQATQDEQTLAQPRADLASQTPSSTDLDCHHCCAAGLAGHQTVLLPPAPAVHAERIKPDGLSVSLQPGLRPPIV